MNTRPMAELARYDLTFEAVAADRRPMVLTQSWIEATTDDEEHELLSGAGLGSPWLELRSTVQGVTTYHRIDMGEFLKAWIEQAQAALQRAAADEHAGGGS